MKNITLSEANQSQIRFQLFQMRCQNQQRSGNILLALLTTEQFFEQNPFPRSEVQKFYATTSPAKPLRIICLQTYDDPYLPRIFPLQDWNRFMATGSEEPDARNVYWWILTGMQKTSGLSLFIYACTKDDQNLYTIS